MECYCGVGRTFSECCEPRLNGQSPAETPEALMRSRYSAFCTQNIDYLAETTDPQTRLEFDFDGNREWAANAKFLKLEVLQTTMDGNKGTVEFKAHFQMPGETPVVHHEFSKFRKQAGRWYFRDGRVLE